MTFAVLTGDIVESSALSARDLDATFNAIQQASATIGAWSDTSALGYARRGGDAWQIALGASHFGLRAALFIRASLRRLHKSRTTRIALAEGEGTLPHHGDTNMAHGPAFTLSGRLLEDLPNHALMSHAAGGAKAATLHLADHIAQGWTQAQARALCELLPPDPGPRSAAAARLDVSRQAVDQALWAAGYPALDAALTAWEA